MRRDFGSLTLMRPRRRQLGPPHTRVLSISGWAVLRASAISGRHPSEDISEPDEDEKQEALEHLAALSVLARWVDACEVVKVDPLEYLTPVRRLRKSPESCLLAPAATAAVSSAPGFCFVALSRLSSQSATHDAHRRGLDADVGCCWRGGVRCQRRGEMASCSPGPALRFGRVPKFSVWWAAGRTLRDVGAGGSVRVSSPTVAA